jgi:hypothetical protein
MLPTACKAMVNVSIPSVFSIHQAFNSSAKELITSKSHILLHKYSQFNSCHTTFLRSLQIWCEKQPGADDFVFWDVMAWSLVHMY